MAGPVAKPQAGKNWEGHRGSMGGGGEEEGKALLPQRTSKWKCLSCFLINYTCKFEKSLRVVAQETGSLFFISKFLALKRCFDGSSVMTNALRRQDTNIQFIRGAAPRILSVTLL